MKHQIINRDSCHVECEVCKKTFHRTPFGNKQTLEECSGKDETGDQGQRYECSMDVGAGGIVVMGWTDELESVDKMRKSVELHPVWSNFQVKDRRPDDSNS